MKILITGSTGFIGLNLIEKLYKQGHEIRAIIRNPGKACLIENFASEIIQGDLKDPDSLKGVFSQVEICYHLSGLTKSPRISDFWENNYHASKNLINEAKRTAPGLRHFIMLSSLAASKPCSSPEGTKENEPEKPVSSYGQSKLCSELYLKKAGINWTIIRPPIVYGPRDRDVFAFFRMAKLGFIPIMGAKKRYSIIYVEDLVDSLIRIMDQPAAYGRIYNVGEPESYTFAEIAGAICRASGKKPLLIPVPEFMLYLTAPLYELFARLTGVSPLLTRDKLLEIIQDGWVSDPGLIRQDFGISAGFSLEAGTKKTCDWYKVNGWL